MEANVVIRGIKGLRASATDKKALAIDRATSAIPWNDLD